MSSSYAFLLRVQKVTCYKGYYYCPCMGSINLILLIASLISHFQLSLLHTHTHTHTHDTQVLQLECDYVCVCSVCVCVCVCVCVVLCCVCVCSVVCVCVVLCVCVCVCVCRETSTNDNVFYCPSQTQKLPLHLVPRVTLYSFVIHS